MRPKALVQQTRSAIQEAPSIAFKTMQTDVLLSLWAKARVASGCATIAPPIWVLTITILLETHPYALTNNPRAGAWEVQCPDKATHVVRQASRQVNN